MIIPIDFNNAEIARGVFYGGDAGAKNAIIHDGDIWMLKFPKTTRDLINPQISYTTSPLSEYIGSKIYEALGVPVHETLLGVRNNKIVVACKDFTRIRGGGAANKKQDTTLENQGAAHGNNGMGMHKYLIPFHDLKNSFMSSDLESYSGTGSETLLDEVLATIAGQDELKSIPGVLERFWDMFVIDAFIGNNDRNNGNWGILINPASNVIELAPVFDNGNAFFNKRGVDQMVKRMNNEAALREDAYLTPLCAYKYSGSDSEGQKINPFTFMRRNENADCRAAAARFLKSADLKAIEEIIYSIPEFSGNLSVMPKVQKEFYIKLMQIRLDRIAVITG